MSSFETFDPDQGVNVLCFNEDVPNDAADLLDSLSPEDVQDILKDPSCSDLIRNNRVLSAAALTGAQRDIQNIAYLH